jgi:hypothetical protein
MFCPNCHMMREDSPAACPYCGAMSPRSGTLQAGSWGDQPFYTFEQSPTFGASQMANQFQQQEQVALVPYRGQTDMQPTPVTEQNATLQVMPAALGAGIQLAPAPQRLDEPSIVYVPPMYTKPRPIIPRYRIISGLLSVLIVVALLCTGAGYYAKVSGKLDALRMFVTGAAPNNVPPTVTATPIDPGDQLNTISAAAVTISSATLTSHRAPNNPYFAVQADSLFKVNQTFYVIYNVQSPKTSGIVSLKWYTNCQGPKFINCVFYTETISKPLAANPSGYDDGYAEMRYYMPTQGKVELYWNNQLAQTLYFAVRN